VSDTENLLGTWTIPLMGWLSSGIASPFKIKKCAAESIRKLLPGCGVAFVSRAARLLHLEFFLFDLLDRLF
jgi:hypothetical protein